MNPNYTGFTQFPLPQAGALKLHNFTFCIGENANCLH